MRCQVLLRGLCLLLLCAQACGQESTYDTSTNILTIPSVKVGSATYTNVTLLNIGSYTFTLQGATAQVPAGPAGAVFDGTMLMLPAVRVGGASYAATLRHAANYTFTLDSAVPVQAFVYYSKTARYPQIATLRDNGTLTMDGLAITNFIFGASASDSTGTLVQWASPWNNYNQPVVQAMLFCGPDEKLAYVLLLANADDPDRIKSNATELMASIHDASPYDGVSVYRNCYGSFSDKWLNNKPNTNYFLWTNLSVTYDYAVVATQLDGAAIYREVGTPANQHNFLGITWRAGNVFEVWQ